jgi:hypothetical protein
MTEQNAETQVQANNVVVTLDGRDVTLTQESLGLTMESTERQVLDAVRAVVEENLTDEDGEFSFTVRKAMNTNTIHVYPKPVAG